MAKAPETAATEAEKSDQPAICGIVMPIAGIGDLYPEEHWRRVRKILIETIRQLDMTPQLVWEKAETDVIHSAILQNIYENDIVICDVSGLNANVMLEAGLRLSTKKPTIIITDNVTKPPFDINTIGYIVYQRDLEFNAIQDFIVELKKKITGVHTAYIANRYQSFVDNFIFETVTPAKVTVSGEQFMAEQIAKLADAVKRFEGLARPFPETWVPGTIHYAEPANTVIPNYRRYKFSGTERQINSLRALLTTIGGFADWTIKDLGDSNYTLAIYSSLSESGAKFHKRVSDAITVSGCVLS